MYILITKRAHAYSGELAPAGGKDEQRRAHEPDHLRSASRPRARSCVERTHCSANLGLSCPARRGLRARNRQRGVCVAQDLQGVALVESRDSLNSAGAPISRIRAVALV